MSAPGDRWAPVVAGAPRPDGAALVAAARDAAVATSAVDGGRATKVLIVGGHALARAGLAALIQAATGLEVVGQAATGEQAVALAAARRPDVVLIDMDVAGMNVVGGDGLGGVGVGGMGVGGVGMGGVAVTEAVLARCASPRPRVLVLCGTGLECVDAALRAGARGVLLRDTAPERLVAAIHVVAGGEGLFAPSVSHRLVSAYVRHGRPRQDPPPSLSGLTGREIEVLRLVARGLSNTDIAGELVVAEATVKTHLNRTMTKLNLTSRAQAVVVAYETGLVAPGRAVS
ncbi:response regulator transcription factor [Rugosimonospora acidiphila]|uniref:Response regulator transcription factor n=1 Tax=Rugosimonospora acidiphila TaxID=556531 RepID=A0ABP9SU36_9ACTN